MQSNEAARCSGVSNNDTSIAPNAVLQTAYCRKSRVNTDITSREYDFSPSLATAEPLMFYFRLRIFINSITAPYKNDLILFL
ncbi:hypothetical protein, partial [Serratia ureilytica]|uniref:hypothetical protein n=1 Tax=Serratia ureilytica TaxID=300181 RepID=UPI00254A1496